MCVWFCYGKERICFFSETFLVQLHFSADYCTCAYRIRIGRGTIGCVSEHELEENYSERTGGKKYRNPTQQQWKRDYELKKYFKTGDKNVFYIWISGQE